MKKNFSKKIGKKYDVAVIGGGPSGMIAAGRAAEMGARVVLLEKNAILGKKLAITGKGRCNITQAEFDDREIIRQFGTGGKFLFSSLAVFGPEEVIEFFEKRGVATKVERGGRVFPVSDKAQDVLNVLRKYLEENKVFIEYEAGVSGFNFSEKNAKKIVSVKTKKGEIFSDQFILCTGGKSYPATGSTGDGYLWAHSGGHLIVSPAPALVPIKIKEAWVKDLQGLSLKNIGIVLMQKGGKQERRFGELLFTHFGLSGPIVLDISKKAGEFLAQGETTIAIDLKPALTPEQLDLRLQRDFQQHSNKDFINYLSELLPHKMIKTIISLVEIPERKKINLVSREERKRLAALLKGLALTVEGTTGYNQAIVTSGGISLKEVDSKTMQSKKISNLYFAGEILDLDGPTGGYNLQLCWSTGYAAGSYAGKNKNK